MQSCSLADIIPEQNASKIVKKNISTDYEVMLKNTVASFFLDTVYITYITVHAASELKIFEK